MKLEVGMYVRSKINGMIGKITDIEKTKVFDSYLTVIREETRYILDSNFNKGFCETEKDSVQTSYNIIDLIEVGDIVVSLNGANILEYNLMTLSNIDELKDLWNIQKNIKSIVTKEQFESMEYKINK